MPWWNWFLLCVGLVNITIVVVNSVMSVVLARRLRRTWVLNRTLTLVVMKAFMLRHQPVWQAWSESLGDIRVQVTGRSKSVDSDAN
jgi:hypothetical protein